MWIKSVLKTEWIFKGYIDIIKLINKNIFYVKELYIYYLKIPEYIAKINFHNNCFKNHALSWTLIRKGKHCYININKPTVYPYNIKRCKKIIITKIIIFLR